MPDPARIAAAIEADEHLAAAYAKIGLPRPSSPSNLARLLVGGRYTGGMWGRVRRCHRTGRRIVVAGGASWDSMASGIDCGRRVLPCRPA